MKSTPLRCTRCGYTPMSPAMAHLRPGHACPQCSAPLALAEAAGASHQGYARPVGREDRGQPAAPGGRRREKPTPREAASGIRKVISLITWVVVVMAITQGSPGRFVTQARQAIERFVRSRGAVTTDPASFTPPGEFAALHGTWMGAAAGDETGAAWTFRFRPGDRVEVDEPDGTAWRGEARVYWGRGAEGGLKVLQGGQPLDLALDPLPGGGSGPVLLGSWRFRDADNLELCLGRPGGEARTSRFRSTAAITCWGLVRTEFSSGAGR
jgi:hypothetical protein